jgi:hypothetical protein
MSAFSGLVAFRSYSLAHPELLSQDVITALRRVSADDGYHDYDAALALHEWIDPTFPHLDVEAFLRHAIGILIERTNPGWRRFFLLGRDRVKGALTANEVQCFEAAGLFSDNPSDEIRRWWDDFQEVARSEGEARRLKQGREGERLTFEYEIKRLSAAGIPKRPRWIALDDNTAGYDIHSFDQGPAEPISTLIEVKSCSRVPQEIFLTRNEWETALEMAPNYRFHIWTLPEERLMELTPKELEKHVPMDRGGGKWEITRIVLP